MTDPAQTVDDQEQTVDDPAQTTDGEDNMEVRLAKEQRRLEKKHADELEKARAEAKAETLAEIEEERKQQEMSELEKAQKRGAELEQAVADAEQRAQTAAAAAERAQFVAENGGQLDKAWRTYLALELAAAEQSEDGPTRDEVLQRVLDEAPQQPASQSVGAASKPAETEAQKQQGPQRPADQPFGSRPADYLPQQQ